jgi:hypothetical protein
MPHLEFLSATPARVMDLLLIAAIAVLLHEARGAVRRPSTPNLQARMSRRRMNTRAPPNDEEGAATTATYREAHRLYLAWVAERSGRACGGNPPSAR